MNIFQKIKQKNKIIYAIYFSFELHFAVQRVQSNRFLVNLQVEKLDFARKSDHKHQFNVRLDENVSTWLANTHCPNFFLIWSKRENFWLALLNGWTVNVVHFDFICVTDVLHVSP